MSPHEQNPTAYTRVNAYTDWLTRAINGQLAPSATNPSNPPSVRPSRA